MKSSRRSFTIGIAALLVASTTGCKTLCDMFFNHEPFLHPGEQYEGQYVKEGYGFNNPNAEKMKDPAYRKSLAP